MNHNIQVSKKMGLSEWFVFVYYCITGIYLFKEGGESPQILATQTVPGDHPYEFKLSAWRQKGYQWQFCIQADQDSKQKEQQVYLPFSVLPKLRQQMVKMQAEDDGSEPIDEMPKIPEWATPGFSLSKIIIKNTPFTHIIN
jgi:hypothetical protein